MKILITGGCGFIGSNYVMKQVIRNHHTVLNLDKLTYAGNMENLSNIIDDPNYSFVQGDICDADCVTGAIDQFQPEAIVHFAAESHVDRSIHAPDSFIQTNIIGTHTLLHAACEVWVGCDNPPKNHLFHHVSTDEVYGTLGLDEPAFSEDSPYAPNSPYAASKAAADYLVRSYHHTYGLNVKTSNCSNNYGPYQFPEKLIPLVIVNALNGESLPVYGDGSNIRDWLYVTDHCRGIDLIIDKGVVGETYNIGGNNERANIDVVKQICSRIDEVFDIRPELKKNFPNAPAANDKRTESLVRFVKDRPGHDWRYAIDATKSMTELTYKPLESFDSGLGRTVDWMIDNETWWKSILDGSYRNGIETKYY